MTETTETTEPLEPVVKPGEDFTDKLTIQEIGIVARQLGTDPIGEIERRGPLMWEAMARCGHLLDRRRRSVKVETWLGLTLAELLTALGDTDDDDETKLERREATQEAEAANPTEPEPAPESRGSGDASQTSSSG